MSKISRLALLLIISYMAPAVLAADTVPKDTTRKTDEAQIKVNPASKARIEFASDTWDFGSIPRGSIVLHSFVIKSIGKDTLVITNVKTSCGCTTAPLSDSSIAPGEQANLLATFNTQNFNGRVKKQVYVDSNDPIKPYLKVSFSAIINNPLQTIMPSPALASFDSVKVNAPAQLKISIANMDKSRADLAIVEQSAPSMVKAVLGKTSLEPGGSTELVLDLQPQSNAGTINQSITLEASNIPDSRFTIPWKAVIVK